MLARGALDGIPEDARINITWIPPGQDDYLIWENAKLNAVIDGVAVMVRQPNRNSSEHIPWRCIETIVELHPRPIKLKSKFLKTASFYDVREHLVERHGVTVSVINNTDNLTAQLIHDEVDHRDLGHFHPDTSPANGKSKSPTELEMIGPPGPRPRLEDITIEIALPAPSERPNPNGKGHPFSQAYAMRNKGHGASPHTVSGKTMTRAQMLKILNSEQGQQDKQESLMLEIPQGGFKRVEADSGSDW